MVQWYNFDLVCITFHFYSQWPKIYLMYGSSPYLLLLVDGKSYILKELDVKFFDTSDGGITMEDIGQVAGADNANTDLKFSP